MLYAKTTGTGVDLVLLHGWGVSSALFADFVAQHQHQYRLTLIDLPGHGKSGEITGGIEQWCAAIIKILPHRPILLGWSLGGLLAIHIANQVPIRQLVLVGTTPNFVQSQNWRYGIPASDFEEFVKILRHNVDKGLKHFVALQSKDKAKLKMLNQSIDDFPASVTALNQGLQILLNTDLRDELKQLKTPVLAILGKNDTLVPVAIHYWYAQHNIPATILNTGHIPFFHPKFSLILTTYTK